MNHVQFLRSFCLLMSTEVYISGIGQWFAARSQVLSVALTPAAYIIVVRIVRCGWAKLHFIAFHHVELCVPVQQSGILCLNFCVTRLSARVGHDQFRHDLLSYSVFVVTFKRIRVFPFNAMAL